VETVVLRVLDAACVKGHEICPLIRSVPVSQSPMEAGAFPAAPLGPLPHGGSARGVSTSGSPIYGRGPNLSPLPGSRVDEPRIFVHFASLKHFDPCCVAFDQGWGAIPRDKRCAEPSFGVTENRPRTVARNSERGGPSTISRTAKQEIGQRHACEGGTGTQPVMDLVGHVTNPTAVEHAARNVRSRNVETVS
jgi:hypothetical protein